MTTMNLGKLARGVGMAMLAGVVTAGPLFTRAAAARDEADVTTCVPDPGNIGGAVVCTIGSSGGPSTFLGAFASDNGGNGGWVEFYADGEGEWWVEHHANGDTQVGWDADDLPGANYITGPQLGSNKEGTYAQKTRPALTGPVSKGVTRSFAAAKAAASKQTGSIQGISAPASVISTPRGASAQVVLTGSGKCMASIIVQQNGAFVSSTGIVPVTMGAPHTVALPSSVGTYTLQVRGKDGCLGQVRSASIVVKRPLFNLMAR